jgi:hypothetical protein
MEQVIEESLAGRPSGQGAKGRDGRKLLQAFLLRRKPLRDKAPERSCVAEIFHEHNAFFRAMQEKPEISFWTDQKNH